MKKFNFKLEKLLMIKEYHEMEAKLKYASELQKKIKIENENREMRKSIIETILNNYLATNDGEVINYNTLEFQDRFVNNLISRIRSNEDKNIVLEEKLTSLRNDLLEATKEKKKFEKLKEVENNKYNDKCKKEEMKEIDEIAGLINLRQKASTSV